jgi:hypothetical protein
MKPWQYFICLQSGPYIVIVRRATHPVSHALARDNYLMGFLAAKTAKNPKTGKDAEGGLDAFCDCCKTR